MKQGKATTVQDRSGKCLTEERQILNRWTEYCSELYNHKANGDPSVLKCTQTDTFILTSLTSIGGRTITNLRFADDIDGLAGEEEELANLVERQDKASTDYVKEISAEKTKLMTNNTSGINTVS